MSKGVSAIRGSTKDPRSLGLGNRMAWRGHVRINSELAFPAYNITSLPYTINIHIITTLR